MNRRLFMLVIDFKKTSEEKNFILNSQMTYTLLSALSIVYDEAFIWHQQTKLILCVFGSESELLLKIFLKNHISRRNVRLFEAIKAEDFFYELIEGRLGAEESMEVRMNSFNSGFELSMEMNCLGPMLFPMVNQAKALFTNNLKLVGLQGSAFDRGNTKVMRARTPGFLYRFSMN
jgi:hypothetical protein